MCIRDRLKNKSNEKLIIKSSQTGKEHEIKLLDNDEYFQYLGITSFPNGDQSKELQQLIQKANEGARVFQSSPFTRYFSHIYLDIHLQSKLFYPLISSSLITEDCQQVEKVYINHTISNMGYSSKWPLALRYGSHNYGGLEIKNLATTALIKKIHGLQNLLYKTESANTVHLVIAWFQHASGLTTPILEPPHAPSKLSLIHI